MTEPKTPKSGTNDDGVYSFGNVTLEAEHVPESWDPAPHDKTYGLVGLPGTVNLYAVFDGGRVLLDRIPASKVFEAVKTANADANTPKYSHL